MKSVVNFVRAVNVTASYVTGRLFFSTRVMQDEERGDERLWDPVELFQRSGGVNYAVIVLNQPILISKHVLLPLWREAKIKITVDGGTNRWLEYLGPVAEEILAGNCPEYQPTFVSGDFDSVTPERLDKLRKLGISVIETPSQNHTDFSKALMQLAATCKWKNISLDAVYVVVENGGRFDHTVGNINTLYKSRKLMGDVHTETIIQVSSNSLTWLVRPGKHRIKIPEVLRQTSSWVGLIPFGGTADNVTTTGLKWNLTNSQLAFGGMVSTSNTYDGSPEVTINTDTKFIWCMGIEPLLTAENSPS